MEQNIEEGKEAEHSPEFDEFVPAGDFAQRSYAQARQQDYQRPGASEAGDVLDRIRGEVIRETIIKELAQREQAGEEHSEFEARKHSRHIAYGIQVRVMADVAAEKR
jgi:hypothetical protein